MKHISKAGGDVLKFAGDAILVLWPPMKKVGNDIKSIPLKARAHAAANCGLVRGLIHNGIGVRLCKICVNLCAIS